MPHSLRAKLSGLHYKGILEDKDYKRLCKALDNEKVLEQIRAEIEKHTDGNNHCDEYLDGYNDGMKDSLEIIDKYIKEQTK